MATIESSENKEIYSYLSQYREPTPQWLLDYRSGDSVTFRQVMEGRVGYYPGSWHDGTLIKVGNKAQCVHSFLYLDYLYKKGELMAHLNEPKSVLGYHQIGRIDWTPNDLLPHGKQPLLVRHHKNSFYEPERWERDFFCFTVIMERDRDRDDSWGAERFAITLLCADGIEYYQYLFVDEWKKAPWLFLLQDHGFGCNYDKFGHGGILDRIIIKSGVRPRFVICDSDNVIWSNYSHIAGLNAICDGMHNPRMLWENGPTGGGRICRDVDPLFNAAARFLVVEFKFAATSALQRQFCIGYNRAGRIMDQLEAAGIVGSADAGKPREILVDEASLEQILSKHQAP